MMVLSEEVKILIKNLHICKVYSARQLIIQELIYQQLRKISMS